MVLALSDSAVRNRMGICHLKLGEYQNAEAVFLRGVELNPEDAEMHFNLGQTFHVQEQYNQALFHYSKCTELCNDFARAWYNMGLIFKNRMI